MLPATVILLTVVTLGCNLLGDPANETGEVLTRSNEVVGSPFVGDVSVTSTAVDTSENFGALLFGNSGGAFTPAGFGGAPFVSLAEDQPQTFAASELLRRYTPEELSTELQSYSFSSFKLVADIWLAPTSGDQQAILSWGGGETDLSNYVDLATGRLESTDSFEIDEGVYRSLVMQINAPAETIVGDYGSDADRYPGVAEYSWGDLKPFYSTDSSAQHIIISTFVDRAFAAWLGGENPDLQQYDYADQYQQETGQTLEDLEQWAMGGPLNQDFFDAVANYAPESNPNSGEAWVFLPMHDPIDVTGMSGVTISFEMFMKGLLEVYEPDTTAASYEDTTYFKDGSDRIHVLSSGKTYTDENGHVYYAPLPIRVSYAENANGISVAAP